MQWLTDPQAGFVQPDGRLVRLRPADIAVLVRTGREAAAVRRELQARAVASVYLSDQDSVFASDEAHDLLYWLRAVAAPLDAQAVRAGLATRPSMSRGSVSVFCSARMTASSQALLPLDLAMVAPVMVPSGAVRTRTSARGLPLMASEIGRASCRERV